MVDTVPYFGLHKDEDDISWLLQADGGTTAVGLPTEDCPVQITNKQLACPHKFLFKDETPPVIVRAYESISKNSEMIKLLSPIPYKDRNHCVYIEGNNTYDLFALNDFLQINNPVTAASTDMVSLKGPEKVDAVFRRLNNSNISRYLAYDCRANQSQRIERMIQMTMNTKGRLVLMGERIPFYGLEDFMITIPFDPALKELMMYFTDSAQLRKLGSTILKKYMREAHGN